MQKLYTETDAAAALHRKRRWFIDWVRANSVDPKNGQPLFLQVGRNKRFTAEQLVRIIDLILTEEETCKPGHGSEGWIYFIDSGDYIKIGYSRSPEGRVEQLATGAPNGVKILHIEPGTYQREKVLHRHFAALRAHGEWFRKGPELLEHIEQRKWVVAPVESVP